MFKPSKKTLFVTTATFMIAGSGAAFAFWTQAGSGTGTATTADTVSLQYVQMTNISGLAPDGPDVPVVFQINNPNASKVKVQTVSIAVDPAWSVATRAPLLNACSATDFEVTQPTFTATELAATTGTITVTGQIHMKNRATDQENCKNASVPLVITTT